MMDGDGITQGKRVDSVKDVPPNMKFWRCKACHIRLGILNPECTELRIKYKDLFLFITGGTVRTVCKACGTENTLIDEGGVSHPE